MDVATGAYGAYRNRNRGRRQAYGKLLRRRDRYRPRRFRRFSSRHCMAGTVVPIVFTNARKEIGIEELLNIIAKYTPSPLQAQPAQLKAGDKQTTLAARPGRPAGGTGVPRFIRPALEYEIFIHTHIQRHAQIRHQYDSQRRQEGRSPGPHSQIAGRRNAGNPRGLAGDIITLAKIEDLRIGDLIHDGKVSGQIRDARGP